MPLTTLTSPSAHQRIRTRLAGFSPDAQRRWGSMSPGGAVCHLALAFEMALGARSCSTRTGLLERSVLKYGALHLPVPWPHGVQTLPELVEGVPGMIPGNFDEEHARLLLALDSFVAAEVLAPAHPIFGPMTRWEWMRWGYLHPDHHLRQFGL